MRKRAVHPLAGAAACAVILFAASACDKGSSEKTWDTIQSGLDTVNKQIGPLASGVTSLTTDQLKSINRYEYRVVHFSESTGAAQMEGSLNALGLERWECFSAVATSDGTTVFCRRIPYEMLRYFLKAM